MKPDIIIPTYRPGEKFTRLLSMLKEQDLPYGKLLVVNTEEALMPEEIRQEVLACRDAELTHISREEFDHAGTRRLAVDRSDAHVFICMTDDAVPRDRQLISKLMEPFQDETTAVVYARQLPNPDAGPTESITREFNYPAESRHKTAADIQTLGIKAFFASNVCCAYRRDIYQKLGGFPEEAIFNEDMIYAHKALAAGYGIYYQAEAGVFHSHHYTAGQQFHRNFDLGVSQAMHPEVFGGIASEGEGLRLIGRVRRELKNRGQGQYFPGFLWESAFRYAGYRLGKAYKALPKQLIRACALNKTFAEKL